MSCVKGIGQLAGLQPGGGVLKATEEIVKAQTTTVIDAIHEGVSKKRSLPFLLNNGTFAFSFFIVKKLKNSSIS
jgi:hypothetical protein